MKKGLLERSLWPGGCIIAICCLMLTTCNGSHQQDTKNYRQTTTIEGIDSETDPAQTDVTAIDEHGYTANNIHVNDRSGSAGELYGLAFEAMMKEDSTLNEGIDYIVIDFSDLSHLTGQDQSYILDYLYDQFALEVTALNDREVTNINSVQTLTEEQSASILLQVQKVEINESTVRIDGTKSRPGTGAVGITTELQLQNGSWHITESLSTWIN